MSFREGQVVLILGEVDAQGNTARGTYIGMLNNKQVQVLLPTGYIFTGPEYTLSLEEKDHE